MTATRELAVTADQTGRLDEIVGRRTKRRAPFAMRVADAVASRLAGVRPNRRSFLTTTAVAGSAVAIAPWRFLLQPVSAYAAVCGPASDCSSGWTVFCCTINNGTNACPDGTVTAGWWKADQNSFCGGSARYYVDCNAECGSCGCGPSGICGSTCWNCQCRCNDDPTTCDHRRVCCNEFRYGNCNQDIACVGPVVCRVVSCVPPWKWEPGCTTVSATANQTGLHTAPCLTEKMRDVYPFGAARGAKADAGSLRAPAAGFDMTPSGGGYWVAAANGDVITFGDATRYRAAGGSPISRPIVALAATRTGHGYWLASASGGVFCFGDAPFYGSAAKLHLNQPIVGMAARPGGRGYWLVSRDGGVFCFGRAGFYGSTGAIRLNQPIVGMAATPTARGYWLVAADGGVFCFGDARFYGSTGALRLNLPVVAIAPTPTGRGYWLVAADGGVFSFGDADHHGALTDLHSQYGAAIGIHSNADGTGYWIATDRT